MLRINAPVAIEDFSPAWAFEGSTGAGVRVAVIDSGIEADHPALDQCVDVSQSVEFSVGAKGNIIRREGPHVDVYGHGTACAGIIHSLAPEASITSIRVLDGGLRGKAAAFHAGLAWAVDNRYDVINLSLGAAKREWALAFHETCDRGYFNNCFIVTAANNIHRDSFPSLFSSVTSVASNRSNDPLRFHFNPDPPTEFLARGIGVEVPWLNGTTTTSTGNSFAAPHIAAFATLIKSKHPDLRPFQIKTALWAASANVRESGSHNAPTTLGPADRAGRRPTLQIGEEVLSRALSAASSEDATQPVGLDKTAEAALPGAGDAHDRPQHQHHSPQLPRYSDHEANETHTIGRRATDHPGYESVVRPNRRAEDHNDEQTISLIPQLGDWKPEPASASPGFLQPAPPLTERDEVLRAMKGYKVGEVIQRDAWGTLYAATHNGQARMLRRLETPTGAPAMARARFDSKIYIAARLRHPNVLPIIDFSEYDHFGVMVMPAFSGRLSNMHADRQLNQAAAVAATISILQALGAAHQSDVCHGDLRLANVGIDEHNVIVLPEIGVATAMSNDVRSTTSTSNDPVSLNHLAPEQLEGASIGPSTDIHAAAQILFELLSGSLPYEPVATLGDLIRQRTGVHPRSLSDLAPSLAPSLVAVVDQALSVSPTHRPASTDEFSRMLVAAANQAFGPGWSTNQPFLLEEWAAT